jgi:hypothetical protein
MSIDEEDSIRVRDVGHELVDEGTPGDRACCELSDRRDEASKQREYSPPMMTMFCVLDMGAARQR